MTQTVDSTVGAQSLIDDYDAICKILQLRDSTLLTAR